MIKQLTILLTENLKIFFFLFFYKLIKLLLLLLIVQNYVCIENYINIL
jgi:hypothetical protein